MSIQPQWDLREKSPFLSFGESLFGVSGYGLVYFVLHYDPLNAGTKLEYFPIVAMKLLLISMLCQKDWDFFQGSASYSYSPIAIQTKYILGEKERGGSLRFVKKQISSISQELLAAVMLIHMRTWLCYLGLWGETRFAFLCEVSPGHKRCR